ncbi:VWA domain-containing protein, partial [candidate division KSB1 bacterium]
MQHSAIGLIAFALFLAFQAPVAGADETPPADVRVLIDVSGSMKQNDPHNLRIPALKLLVNLMPPGAWAGVWLFAEQAQPLVPLERVDQNWQKQALALAAKIHSRGQRTDIEAALKKAALERQTADATSRRRLILLTDGLVDVGKEADKNAASKKRI